jgi:phosphoribosylglycinamide formyltransferase-1
MKKIVIFISGRGSLVESFAKNPAIEVCDIIANRECAGLELASKLEIPNRIVKDYGQELAEELNSNGIEVVVLAGFLKVVPAEFIENFKGKIVNSHPALLPKFGGAGFYGDKVHQAVLEAGETESGFTVHLVTPEVDEGPILAQVKVPVLPDDSLESLRQRVQDLEKVKYAEIVAGL